MKRPLFCLILTCAISVSAQPPQPAQPPPASFASTVKPFLELNCQACHNGKMAQGGINFELLKWSSSTAVDSHLGANHLCLENGPDAPKGQSTPCKGES